MKRDTRLFSINNIPLLIYDSPECISDDIVKYNNEEYIVVNVDDALAVAMYEIVNEEDGITHKVRCSGSALTFVR